MYDGFLWRDLNVKRALLWEVQWNIARFLLERLPKHKTGILQEKLLTTQKKNPQPKFESSTSRIQIKRVTTEPNLLGYVYHRR